MARQHFHEITAPSYFRPIVNESSSVAITAKTAVTFGATEGTGKTATANTDVPLGVAYREISAGSHGSVQSEGRALATAGAAVSVGDKVTVNASGRFITATGSAHVWGVAISAAAGNGSDCILELNRLGNTIGASRSVATRTALKAVTPQDGDVVLVESDKSLWVYDSGTEGTADEAEAFIVEHGTTGTWYRCDKSFVLKCPIDYSMSDGDAVLTVPEGYAFRLAGFPWWEVTTGFTGGSSSAIGISTNITGYETGGDIIGGASGDVAATLVAGITKGTVGGELDDLTGFFDLLFEEASELQFDAITSAFTAGAGFVCLPIIVDLAAPATP